MSQDTATAPGMAAGGARATIPTPHPLPEWPTEGPVLPIGEEDISVDALDVFTLNQMMLGARRSLFHASERLKGAQRAHADAEMRYKRAFRRFLVTVSGGSAETRRAMAEIHCEEFENDMVVTGQIVEELKRHAQDCRDNLKAIENISHNLRAQMSVL